MSVPPLSATPAGLPAGRKVTVAVSLWGIFVTNVTLTILTIALPQIAVELHASRAGTNWVTLGPMLVLALLTPAAGRAADTYGRKRVWMGGFALAIAGMAGSGLAPDLPMLVAARFLTGVGAGLMLPAGLAIATEAYPAAERATPVGYWTATAGLSPMLGILIGGWVIEHLSWRWLFAGQVALALPALAMAGWLFREQRFEVEGEFDWRGSLSIGGAALAIMLASTWGPIYGLFHPLPWLALLGGVVLTLLSVRIERRAANPVLPPHMLADTQIRLSIWSRMWLNSVYMGAFIALPYLLAEVWQLSPFSVSSLLLPRPLAMGLTGALIGRLAARFTAPWLIAVGSVAILLSSAMFATLGAAPAPTFLVAALILAGIGLGLAAPGSAAVITGRVGDHELGTASGVMALTSTLANTLGMGALFACVEAFGGTRDPLAYRYAFIVAALVASIGVAVSLRLLAVARREAAA